MIIYRYVLRCDGCSWVTRGEVRSPTFLRWDTEADVQQKERCPRCGPFASIRVSRAIPPNPTVEARQLRKPRTPLRGIPFHHTPRARR